MKAQALGTNVSPEISEQLDEIIARCREEQDDLALLMALFSAGQAHILQGHLDKGQAYINEVIQLMKRFKVPLLNTWVYYAQALLEIRIQHPAEAEKYLLNTIDANEQWGHQRMAAQARSDLGHLYRRENCLKEAREIYRKTIVTWQEQGHLAAVAHQLECFAYLAIAQEQYRRAAHLLGAAHAARQQLDALSTQQLEITELQQAMAQLDGMIGKAKRDQALEEGAQLSLDEAVTLALNDQLGENQEKEKNEFSLA
jgi:hypothetical protein